MRPRIVWRVMAPVTAVLATAAAIGWGGWRWWLGSAVNLFASIEAHREFVRVEDGVLYRRGLSRWCAPLVLDAMSAVELRRVWGGREPFKHLELCLVAGGGNRMTFSLRWWEGTDQLLRAVADAASEPAGDQLSRRQWRLDLDAETRRRLAAYV